MRKNRRNILKIISDFIDYYDFHQSKNSSLDSPMIYNRFSLQCSSSVEYKAKKNLPGINTIKCFISNDWKIEFYFIGFCGNLYKGVTTKSKDKIEHSYTLTGALYIPKEMGIKVSDEIVTNSVNHFSDNHLDLDLNIFSDIGSPIFIIKPKGYSVEIIKNPNLKEYSFSKVRHSYDAFNEVREFVYSIKDTDRSFFDSSFLTWMFTT